MPTVPQILCAQAIGFTPSAPNVTTVALNAATTWLGLGFNLSDLAKTLARVRVFCSNVTGALGAADVSCDIYSDAPGTPNASLASTTTLTAPIAAGSWCEFGGAGAGFNLALAAGGQYWAVLKNLNGTPASNFPTFKYGLNALPPEIGGSGTKGGWCKQQYNGTAWGTGSASVAGLRLEFTDGSFMGLPVQTVIAAGSGDGVYGTRESGVKFTSPANATLNVRGLSFYVTFNGTTTADIRFNLYNGTTLLASTGTIPRQSISTIAWANAYLPATQAIAPGTVLRATVSELTNTDAPSAYFKLQEYQMDPDANSLALKPFQGTLQKTYFDGTTWTDTASSMFPFALLLDSGGEFAAMGAGGFRRQGFNGGF